MAKSKTVKFEVGQLVKFSGTRVGRVSKIAKNGAVYVIVLGETTVVNQTREELRVKKADLQWVNDVLGAPVDAVSVENYIRHVIRNNISCDVSSNAEMAEAGTYELAPDYIPSPGCLEYCEWEGSADAARVLELVGLDLGKLANLYTGKKAEVEEAAQPIEEPIQQEIEEIEEIVTQQASVVPMGEPILPAAAFSLQAAVDSAGEAQSVALADTTYALRELTFSVTRHSILTAFIDVALNKDIPGYHHQVASNIKNLMAASFDPVHDSGGYARINTWMMAALKMVVKNKDRVAKMLNQPIEAAPIKIDRVSKLGMWIDNMMNREGKQVNDLTAAYDSCYMYDALGKKLEAYTFVVVEVIQSGAAVKVEVIKDHTGYYTKHLTAQSAIAARQQYIDCWRQLEPDWHLYCGIIPILKTGLPMQAAIEDTMASVIDTAMVSVIGSLK